MSGGTLSLHLELIGNGTEWSWKLFHRRGNGNASIMGKLPLPRKITPEKAASIFPSGSLLGLSDYAHHGAHLHKMLIPEPIAKIFTQASCGDFLCVVPPQWGSVPFELMYDTKGFLCERFAMGTILHVSKANVFQSGKNGPISYGIIADPAGDLPEAYNEAITIRDFLRHSGCSVRMISSATPNKIHEMVYGTSIIHYAGHSVYSDETDKCGWKLDDGILFNLDSLQENSNLPQLVFSNSCEGGNTSSRLAGVAGTLMSKGVVQVIGPFTKVIDREARECAVTFYKYLHRTNNPSRALYLMRKELSGSAAALVYRLYGDPCRTFANTIEVPKSTISIIIDKTKRKLWVAILAVFVLLLVVILFWPIGGSGVIYVPAP